MSVDHQPAKGWFVRNWKNLIPPSVAVVIVAGIGMQAIFSQASPEEQRAAASEGGREVALEVYQAIEAANAEPVANTPVAERPYYDFLTCEAARPEDFCEPVFAYPLTPDAKQLIGFEPGTSNVNMMRGRSVFVQWRGMHSVNECDLSIGIEARPSADPNKPVADRKLFATKVPGKAQLLDCTPKAVDAKGGLPTVAQS